MYANNKQWLWFYYGIFSEQNVLQSISLSFSSSFYDSMWSNAHSLSRFLFFFCKRAQLISNPKIPSVSPRFTQDCYGSHHSSDISGLHHICFSIFLDNPANCSKVTFLLQRKRIFLYQCFGGECGTSLRSIN